MSLVVRQREQCRDRSTRIYAHEIESRPHNNDGGLTWQSSGYRWKGNAGEKNGTGTGEVYICAPQPHPALVSGADRDGENANTDKQARLRSPLTACSRHHNLRSLLCTAVTPSSGHAWPPCLGLSFQLYTWHDRGKSGNRPQRRLGCEIIPARTLTSSLQRPALDDHTRLSCYLSAAGLAPFW